MTTQADGAKRQVTLRLYEELNDHLPNGRRKKPFTDAIVPGSTVRALLGTWHVPPEAVDLILVDGEPATPEQPLFGGERVAAYPVFEAFNIDDVTRVRARGLRRPRFAVPADLAPLGRRLRAQGYPAIDVVTARAPKGWILVTAPTTQAGPDHPPHHVRLQSRRTNAQLRELLARLQLDSSAGD